jgi:diguanylate cyclase (GGDEF)-like protein
MDLVIALYLLLLVLLGILLRQNRNLQRGLAEATRPFDDYSYLHDLITGFPNRHQLQRRVSPLLSQGQGQYSLLVLKIKNFDEVNRMLGHSHANVVLTQIASRINGSLLHNSDVLILENQNLPIKVCHLSGVDFAIWMQAGDRAYTAEILAQHIEKNVPEPLLLHGAAVEYQIISGIVHAPEHGDQLAELLDKAYEALQQHEWQHSASAVFDPAMMHFNSEKLRMMAQLQAAIGSQQLQLDVQPQVDLSSQQILSFEVLLRWQHPEKGLLAPKLFLPLAEEMGVIYPLTTWVLQQAILILAQLQQQSQQVQIAVNISSRDIIQIEFVEQLQQMLEQANVEPSGLMLELKEEALMADAEAARPVLHRLRALGIELALDDFGTGFTSLAVLRELPIQQVKVDCQFISGLHRSESQAAVTGAIIDMAKNLELQVVAEGIEEELVADKLLRLGCTRGQGFLYSKPFALSGLTYWLAQWQSNHPPAP